MRLKRPLVIGSRSAALYANKLVCLVIFSLSDRWVLSQYVCVRVGKREEERQWGKER